MVDVTKTPKKRGERGQGLVEFALILPLLLTLILGVFEFGRLMFLYSMTSAASREAARYGTASGAINIGGTPRYLDCAEIRNAATRVGAFAGITNANITIQYDNGPGTAIVGICGAVTEKSLQIGSRIIITVNASYDPNLPFGDLPAFNIGSTTTRTIVRAIPVGTPIALDSPLSVSFQVPSQVVTENMGTVSVNVVLSTVSTQDVVVPITVVGTATAGDDYIINTTFPLVIWAGNTSASISVTIIDDGIVEFEESVIFLIGSPSGAVKGAPGSHTMIIEGVPQPPDVFFVYLGSSIEESDTVLDIEVGMNKIWTADVIVPFTVSGTATEGVDYTISASPIVIPAGNDTAFIQVTIIDDPFNEPDETIVLALGDPTEGVKGYPDTYAITIIDDDKPIVSFAIASQTVNETVGTVNVIVQMDQAGLNDVIVPFTLGGLATLGDDYAISASPVLIPAGATQGIISINVANQGVEETDEDIIITLGEPVNGELGTPDVYTLIIKGDVPIPNAYFEIASQNVEEAVGVVTVVVSLSQPFTSGNVTIPFSLSGTAINGDDYTIDPSPLVIPAGATQGTIQVAIIDDDLREPAETIILTMGTPINAFRVQARSTHVITIAFSDPYANLSLEMTYNHQYSVPYKEKNILFIMTLRNAGPDTAENILVSAPLPTGYAIVLPTSTSQGSYSGNNWSAGTLPTNGTATLSINATIQNTGVYSYYAQVMSSSVPDMNSTHGDSSDGDDDDVTVNPDPQSECGALFIPNYLLVAQKLTWSATNDGKVNYLIRFMDFPWTGPSNQRLDEVRISGGLMAVDDRSLGFTIGQYTTPGGTTVNGEFAWPSNTTTFRTITPGQTADILLLFRASNVTAQLSRDPLLLIENLDTNRLCGYTRPQGN